jgi:hypothetical protein
VSRRSEICGQATERLSTTTQRRAVVLILLAAFASFVLSVSLWFSDHKDQGLFAGLWAPSILVLGALVLVTLNADRE